MRKHPTHDDIAERAEILWKNQGCPTGRDTEIWLEAEQQLIKSVSAPALDEDQSDHALEEKAALQKKDALSPQRPKKKAPKSKPAPPGKPLWNQPHSK